MEFHNMSNKIDSKKNNFFFFLNNIFFFKTIIAIKCVYNIIYYHYKQ